MTKDQLEEQNRRFDQGILRAIGNVLFTAGMVAAALYLTVYLQHTEKMAKIEICAKTNCDVTKGNF